MNLEAFRARHIGEPVVILGNGMSLLDHKLSEVTCATVTLNRAWSLLWPTYHVCIESEHERQRPDIYAKLADEGKLFVQGWHFGAEETAWGRAHRIPITTDPRVTFSRDLVKDGARSELNGVGSVTYVALQLANYMGFGPIYVLGLDLGGRHFHGEWHPSTKLERQNEPFAHVPADVHVYVVGSPQSRCTAFEHMTFGGMVECLKTSAASCESTSPGSSTAARSTAPS